MTVSGNANQAVANDDFEAFQREANKADLQAKFGMTAKEEPPAAKESAKAPEADAQSAAESGKAAPKEQKKGFGSLSPSELRAKARELQAEIDRLKQAPAKAEEVEEVPSAEAKQPEQLRARPKADDQIDGKPKYETWEKYEDDLLAWNTEKILSTIDERNAKKVQEAQVEAVNKTIEQSWRERVNKSRELHEDFDEALGPDGPGKLIQPGSLIDEWIMDSEHGAELFYYFHQNPAELLKFGNFPGNKAAVRRALVKLEDQITVALPEKPKAEEKAEKPEIRVTKTPKPGSEVGGRGHAPADPILAAVADGSDAATRRYIDEQNHRDIRAKFGDRR